MLLACTICTAICGNGVPIIAKIIHVSSCAVVRGASILVSAVRLIAASTLRASVTTMSVFGLSVLRRGLISPLSSCPFALFPLFFSLSAFGGSKIFGKLAAISSVESAFYNRIDAKKPVFSDKSWVWQRKEIKVETIEFLKSLNSNSSNRFPRKKWVQV